MKIRIGRPEWIFASLLAACILLSFVPGAALPLLFLKLTLFLFAVWVFVRFTKLVVVDLLWRLRNRLIVAYVFIALVPVILVTVLAGIGVYLIGGQLSIYLVTSEMERRMTTLRNVVEGVAERPPDRVGWAETMAPALETNYPGLELLVQDKARWMHPNSATLRDLPERWKPGSGLVMRGEALYGWAYAAKNGRRVTAMFPVTREFLGALAPDVCDSSIRDLDSPGKTILHTSLPLQTVSHNRLPPAVNRVDFEIGWSAPIQMFVEEQPDHTDTRWLIVRTRPSAVLRTIFAQKVDWASELVPLLFFSVATLFLIAELIALVIGVSLTRTITGAIHNLYEGTLRARASDFSHRIPIQGTDQLAELAVSFNHMTSNMERLLVVEKERERLQTELEIAREVQNQLYPRNLPSMVSVHVIATCSPARMVSGDYYDYQQVGPKKLAIAIGDVAGKGISAALLMATIQSSFRSQLRACIDVAVESDDGQVTASVSTSRLVTHLNQQLYADTAPEKFATFYLGVYDGDTHLLTYTNAGHLPPILVRNGRAERLEVNGMVVGAFPGAKYDESQLQLESGDLVVFFTDGISEPENAYGEMFGEERLMDLAVRSAHLPNEKIVSAVMDSVREWTGAGELQDDMTLLLLRKQ